VSCPRQHAAVSLAGCAVTVLSGPISSRAGPTPCFPLCCGASCTFCSAHRRAKMFLHAACRTVGGPLLVPPADPLSVQLERPLLAFTPAAPSVTTRALRVLQWSLSGLAPSLLVIVAIVVRRCSIGFLPLSTPAAAWACRLRCCAVKALL